MRSWRRQLASRAAPKPQWPLQTAPLRPQDLRRAAARRPRPRRGRRPTRAHASCRDGQQESRWTLLLGMAAQRWMRTTRRRRWRPTRRSRAPNPPAAGSAPERIHTVANGTHLLRTENRVRVVHFSLSGSEHRLRESREKELFSVHLDEQKARAQELEAENWALGSRARVQLERVEPTELEELDDTCDTGKKQNITSLSVQTDRLKGY